MIDWRGAGAEGWVANSIATLEQCAAAGVRGWKIPKVLGLGAGDGRGHRLRVDDPMLDPIFERASSLHLVVLIHSGDPRAFFEPNTPANERWDELRAHPAWSFADPIYPRWTEILDEFERRVLRHPGLRFIGAHFGNAAEEPDRVESPAGARAQLLHRHLRAHPGVRPPRPRAHAALLHPLAGPGALRHRPRRGHRPPTT
jgi:hypothetical protein